VIAVGDVHFRFRRRKHDDRYPPQVLVSLEDGEDLTAVLPRQVEVQQNERRRPRFRPIAVAAEEVDRLDPVFGYGKFYIALVGDKHVAGQFDIRHVVFNQ